MLQLAQTHAFEACAALTVAGSTSISAYVLSTDRDCLPRRAFTRYVASLERKLRRLFMETRGQPIAVAQTVAIAAVVALRIAVAFPYWYLAIALIALAPHAYIERLRVARTAALEKQVQPFILALANALRTTPSIGQALTIVQPLLAPPLAQEIELVLKETRVGSSLEQALLHLGGRARVADLEAALSSVLVGRQVGGNLPEILDTTAGTLREMARLGGVIRSKTASGRTQLIVLALAPVVVLFGFEKASPGFFTPLNESLVGMMVAGLAGVLWVSALVIARQVLSIEL